MEGKQNNVKTMRIDAFAKRIGVSCQTLRRWDAQGLLKPAYVFPSGQRRYTEQQVTEYIEACKKKAEKS